MSVVSSQWSNSPCVQDMQVTIDSQGVMKVMHMVSLTCAPPMQAAYHGMSQSQHSGRKGWVQFMLLPQDAIVEFDGDDDA